VTRPEFVAFDLETTGLSPKTDQIIEIGAVRLGSDLRPVSRFETVVDPGRSVPIAVQRLTGLGEADLAGCPSPLEAVAQLADFCDGARLIAHGAGFDLGFCAAQVPAAFDGRPVLDTLELARILLPLEASHSLPLLSSALSIEHERPHRALSDAAATASLFGRLVEVGESMPASLLASMRALVRGSSGPLADFMLAIVRGDGDQYAPVREGAPRRIPARRAAPQAPAPAPRDASLAAAAAAILGPVGPLASAMPGYELRPAQVEMARAVAQTLERSGRLLVEAGTGIGKSLAYLVPLALWSARTGRRAVVATHTITLQEQLGERDLPRLTRDLGLDVSHAVLKGRQHYISLRRWQRVLATPDHGPHGTALDMLRFKLKLLVWLAQTETGDRTELRLAGAEEILWRRVESTSDDCLGRACANWRDGRCYMVAARRNAADADIVVTNHALLLADAERQGQVMTPYSALVVDEAHHLEESATRQLGQRIRAAELLAIIDRLGPGDGNGQVEASLAHAREGILRIFGEVKGLIAAIVGSDNPGNAIIGLSPTVRSDHGFEQLVKAAWHAVRTLREAADALLGARGAAALQGAFFPQPDRLDDELELAADALGDAAAAMERIICVPREGHVTWLELRAEQAELHEAPISVAEQLAEGLFERADATVLTSATLAVAGSFGFVKTRTGVGLGAAELVLPSPFDFLSQALCVIAGDVPPYDSEGYEAVLAELCADVALRLGGRALVLFTGYAPLRSVHALLRPRLEPAGLAVLGQGLDGTRRQVLASFVQNPRTVLLGTSTFWEGIDVPGDALSCVIIAKLPFPVPTDPLVQARGARLGDPFTELALPMAVLRLKQGFGRLIRRGDDRGAVVLCDERIASKDYGSTFLAALPEALATRTPRGEVGAVVEAFVRHGAVPSGAAELRALAEIEPGRLRGALVSAMMGGGPVNGRDHVEETA
jgi:DNA polymerase III epsilon subunit family exonuclease